MSSSYKSSVKEMRKERRKAKQHPTNVRRSVQKPSILDIFAGDEIITSTVDGFTKLNVHKPVEIRCANPGCRKVIVGPKYTLTVKDKEGVYRRWTAKTLICLKRKN